MSNHYEILDSGGFLKLEQVGSVRLVRPCAQAIWSQTLTKQQWEEADAVFVRKTGGDGDWNFKNRKLPESWTIQVADLKFVMRLTDFGHLGIFPEQMPCWKLLTERCQRGSLQMKGQPFKVLNLFAYTGGSTMACAAGGAEVVHLDASKTSVAWARENAMASGLSERPIRWIVDDVKKFVEREIRREIRYHGIILDPPSFGRGANGEVWKLEEHLTPLMHQLRKILAEDFSFVQLSAHSPGVTPIVLENLLRETLPKVDGTYLAEEMVIPDKHGHRLVPSGASCFFLRGQP